MSLVVREAVPEDAGDIAAAHTEGWRRGYRGLIADDVLRSELLGFYVHPDFWGTGAAQSLIERCHLGLQRFGLAAVLWVLRDNPRARAFYERNGWACGHGEDLVEHGWVGPAMAGLAEFDDPLPEVQYRRVFR